MICKYCGQETRDSATTGCTGNGPGKGWTVEVDDYVDPVLYDGYCGERCPECGVTAGNYHHAHCGYEICPICGGYLDECDCFVLG